VQIAHAFQGHPLGVPVLRARTFTLPGEPAARIPSRRLLQGRQWLRRDQLALEQEARASGRSHSAWLRAAQAAGGGTRVERVHRTVGGPASSEVSTTLPTLPSPAPQPPASPPPTQLWPQHQESYTAVVATVAGEAQERDTAHPGESASNAVRGRDETVPNAGRERAEHGGGGDRAHSAILGKLLGGSKRTLLLLPSAEALAERLSSAERAGPSSLLLQ
jgi:hypothetical protein